jgi:colicin import membrane protein
MYKTLFVPLMMTVVLHFAVILFFVVPWSNSESMVRKVPTNIIKAELVTLEKPKAKPKAKKPKPVKKTVKKRPVEKKVASQKKTVVKPKTVEADKKAALEKERQRQAEQQRRQQELEQQRQREQADREAELAEAMEEEESLRQAESDVELATSYIALITEAIQNQWNRPPSARNNMEAELVLQLVPTGDVVGVSVVKSSGNIAFDRSAEQAVLKVKQFPELKKLPPRVFENYFRRLRLKFRPEDLRR